MKKNLEAAVANICRQAASVWLSAMSYREVDFEWLAQQTGQPAEKLSATVHELVDGKCGDLSLKLFAYCVAAMDMKLEFSLIQRAQRPIEEERSDDERSQGNETVA